MDEAANDEVSPDSTSWYKRTPASSSTWRIPRPADSRWARFGDSQAQQEARFNEHVKPNLAVAVFDALSTEYIQLHVVVQP